ncbi:MAG: hypothetical protein Q9195_004709 [Heterodermia aff. obscurata]
MSDEFVEIPLTPPFEVEASTLMNLYLTTSRTAKQDAIDTISLDSNTTTLVNDYEPVTSEGSSSNNNQRNQDPANRALASMVFNPDAAPPAAAESEEDDPPLILSTERTEELVESEPESEQPTRFTVAEFLNAIEEHNIELPESDDEEDMGQEGAGMGDLGEEEVLEEIEKWEAAKAKAKAEGEAGEKGKAKAAGEETIKEGTAQEGKGKGKAPAAVDDNDEDASDDDEQPAAAPKLTAAQRKKKRKGGKKHRRAPTKPPTPPPPPFLEHLNSYLARGEHVVDTKKVLREAEEAEARGEEFDMVGRIKALQDGSASDSGPLVDAVTPWLRGRMKMD